MYANSFASEPVVDVKTLSRPLGAALNKPLRRILAQSCWGKLPIAGRLTRALCTSGACAALSNDGLLYPTAIEAIWAYLGVDKNVSKSRFAILIGVDQGTQHTHRARGCHQGQRYCEDFSKWFLRLKGAVIGSRTSILTNSPHSSESPSPC